MDLVNTDTKKLGCLIESGSLQLDELPLAKRNQVAALLKQAPISEPAPIDDTPDELTIEDAIRTVLAEGNKEDLTRDGKPIVRAVEAIFGKDISAADRDEAYDNITSED